VSLKISTNPKHFGPIIEHDTAGCSTKAQCSGGATRTAYSASRTLVLLYWTCTEDYGRRLLPLCPHLCIFL